MGKKQEYNKLSKELHSKILRIYSKQIFGAQLLYIGLATMATLVTCIAMILQASRPDITVTRLDLMISIVIGLALIIVDVAVVAEYIIVPRNVEKNRLRYITAKAFTKKELSISPTSSNLYYKYEIYHNNDVFRLACADEYSYLNQGEPVNLIYVKSAFSKNFQPLMVYKPDEKGLDYELLKEKPCTYAEFIDIESDDKPVSRVAVKQENYHDDLNGDKTERLLKLENSLAKAPAGSKEQLRLMEEIGAERHRIKKSKANKNRMQKLKEIIAIIRR